MPPNKLTPTALLPLSRAKTDVVFPSNPYPTNASTSAVDTCTLLHLALVPENPVLKTPLKVAGFGNLPGSGRSYLVQGVTRKPFQRGIAQRIENVIRKGREKLAFRMKGF